MSSREGRPVRVLVAPDSFKGTLAAATVASWIAEGIRDAGGGAVEFPVADGGEGTLDAICAATGARRVAVETQNAWGAPIVAEIAMLGGFDGAARTFGPGTTAIVELATAAGLTLPHDGVRDPVTGDTYGVGVLVHAAVASGARRVLVAAGGSATTDGGEGAVRAIIERGGVGDAEIVVLADVMTTFVDAADVFAPQKGADARQVSLLRERLRDQARRAPRDPSDVPGTGAAGGFAGGLWAHLGATIVGGAAAVLDACGFDDVLPTVDLVVVGEGRLDSQTASGKIVDAILHRGEAAGVPVAAVVGSVSPDLGDAYAGRFAEIVVAHDADELRSAGRRLAERNGAVT